MDQKNLLSHTFELIRKQRFHQRWRQVMTCLAAVVVFLTTYMLILPAITMEHGSMEVTATASEMFLGETNYTEIHAKADDGRAETVFALTADGENAGLDGKRIKFSDGGTAKIPTRDGEKVELHREYQEDGHGVGVGGDSYRFRMAEGIRPGAERRSEAGRLARAVLGQRADPESSRGPGGRPGGCPGTLLDR